METTSSPIRAKVAGVFIPVKDIEKARDWYCRILGISSEVRIVAGHLCPLPVEGPGLILDTMPGWGGKEPGGAPTFQTPAFMFPTNDLQGAYRYMQELGVELVSGIEHDHWFVFKDPDGNMLMVVKE